MLGEEAKGLKDFKQMLESSAQVCCSAPWSDVLSGQVARLEGRAVLQPEIDS